MQLKTKLLDRLKSGLPDQFKHIKNCVKDPFHIPSFFLNTYFDCIGPLSCVNEEHTALQISSVSNTLTNSVTVLLFSSLEC